MTVWDTPGGDHFCEANKADYENAHVVIMVYAIDAESSFDTMGDLYEKVQAMCPKAAVYLVGNKYDLDAKGQR